MTTAVISSKYQVVIPKDIREALGLKVGQRVNARVQDGSVVLEPELTIADMRGIFPGIDTAVPNDPEDYYSEDFT